MKDDSLSSASPGYLKWLKDPQVLDGGFPQEDLGVEADFSLATQEGKQGLASNGLGILPYPQVSISPSTKPRKGYKQGMHALKQGMQDELTEERVNSRVRGRSEASSKSKTGYASSGYATGELKIEDSPNQAENFSCGQPALQEAFEVGRESQSEMASQPGQKELDSHFILDDQGLDFVTEDSPLSSLPELMFPGQKVHGWGLPGHGEAQESCGNFFRKICLNISEHPDGSAVFLNKVHSCHRPTCPVCWMSWVLREARRISYKILETAKSYPWLGKPIHVTASVPGSLYHLSFKELKAKLYPLLKKVGFLGGCVILHIYRQDKDSGLWFFSPHFHMIGFGWIKDVASTFASSGWVIKNLGVRNNVFGTAFYQLTHCAVWYGKGRKHSVTWIGELSYNKLKISPRPQKSVCCPYCGEKMETAVRIVGFPEPLPCPGIDGFYLASAEGWTTRSSLYYASLIPDDFVSKFLSISPENVLSLDLLL